jgi:hypothetical protein
LDFVDNGAWTVPRPWQEALEENVSHVGYLVAETKPVDRLWARTVYFLSPFVKGDGQPVLVKGHVKKYLFRQPVNISVPTEVRGNSDCEFTALLSIGDSVERKEQLLTKFEAINGLEVIKIGASPKPQSVKLTDVRFGRCVEAKAKRKRRSSRRLRNRKAKKSAFSDIPQPGLTGVAVAVIGFGEWFLGSHDSFDKSSNRRLATWCFLSGSPLEAQPVEVNPPLYDRGSAQKSGEEPLSNIPVVSNSRETDSGSRNEIEKPPGLEVSNMEGSKYRWMPWTLCGVGTAGLATGVTVGLMGWLKQEEISSGRGEMTIDSARSQWSQANNSMTIGWAVGGLSSALLTGGILWLTGDSK